MLTVNSNPQSTSYVFIMQHVNLEADGKKGNFKYLGSERYDA